MLISITVRLRLCRRHPPCCSQGINDRMTRLAARQISKPNAPISAQAVSANPVCGGSFTRPRIRRRIPTKQSKAKRLHLRSGTCVRGSIVRGCALLGSICVRTRKTARSSVLKRTGARARSYRRVIVAGRPCLPLPALGHKALGNKGWTILSNAPATVQTIYWRSASLFGL